MRLLALTLALALGGAAWADDHTGADPHTEHHRVMAFVDEGFSFAPALEGPTGGWTRVKRVTPEQKRERATRNPRPIEGR